MQGILPKKSRAEEREFYSRFAYRRSPVATRVSLRKGGGGKRRAVFVTAAVVICLLLAVSAADLFLGGAALGLFASGGGKNISVAGVSYYAVETGGFTSDNEARAAAETIKGRGGAGYIYNDGKFHVLAAAYEKKSDAEKVKSQLDSSGVASELFTITIPPVSAAYSGTKQQKTAVKTAINYHNALFKKLYEISESLDTGAISEASACLRLQTLESETKTVSDDFLAALNAYYESEISDTRAAVFTATEKRLSASIETVKELYYVTVTRTSLSRDIKYAAIKIICNYKNPLTQ